MFKKHFASDTFFSLVINSEGFMFTSVPGKMAPVKTFNWEIPHQKRASRSGLVSSLLNHFSYLSPQFLIFL